MSDRKGLDRHENLTCVMALSNESVKRVTGRTHNYLWQRRVLPNKPNERVRDTTSRRQLVEHGACWNPDQCLLLFILRILLIETFN